MQGSLLTIGDELLIGQVMNSNVTWMSERLTNINCRVSHHLTVGDQKEEIKKALDYLLLKSDFIIIGGGLGPTHDDLTMEVLSEHFDIPLFYDEDWISKVDAYFKSRNRVMSENNKKQGYLLQTANRIDNDCGTAAGQHFTVGIHEKNTEIFVVPGVPYEMKSMMERYILPEISKKTLKAGEKILKSTLLTTGIGESALAERCAPFVQKIKSIPEVTLAFLPSSTQVRLRLQTSSKSEADESRFQSLVDELKAYCGKDFYGFEPTTLEKNIIEHLRKNNQTLAVAESCTGGLISHLLTQIPGSSEALRGSMIAYQTELKTSELGIPEETLKNFGVVSKTVAIAMAEAIRKKWGTTYGVATTGYIGPSGGDEFAKLGEVWIAVSTPETTTTKSLYLENHRERNKERSAQAALDLLRRLF